MNPTKKRIEEHPEDLEMLSQRAKKMWANEDYRESRSGENHPMYGKKRSQESIAKAIATRKSHHFERTQKQIEALEKVHQNYVSKNKILTPVRCVELDIIYDNPTEAAKETGFNSNCIIRVCKNKRETYKGYHWEFVNEMGNNNC